MKKILTILGALALTSTALASVIACGSPAKQVQQPLAKDDLSTIIKITDLGLIKDNEVIGSDFFHVALNKVKEKNPLVKAEIIDHLTYGSLNIYVVDGSNVSIMLIPEQGFEEVVGKVTVNFIVEESSQLSLIDVKNLEHAAIGKFVLQQGVDKPEDGQILNAFLLANPAYEKDRSNFEVVSIEPNSGKNGTPFIAKISISETNPNYNFRFMNYLKVSFIAKQSVDNSLTSFITSTNLGEIKDNEVVSGDYWNKVLDVAQQKNPNLSNQIRNNLVSKGLNTYKVDGLTVSTTLIPQLETDQIIGEATIKFTMEDRSKTSLIDVKHFEQEIIGGFDLLKGVIEPDNQQILNAFLIANPNFALNRKDFSAKLEVDLTTSDELLVATIKVGDDNSNYDLRLGTSFKVSFTTKESANNDLSSIIKVIDLGLIKDSEVIGGDYQATVLELLQQKNPNFSNDIRQNLVPKDLNVFKVDDSNVSVTFIPKEGYEQVTGQVTVNFTVYPSSQLSLIDVKNLKVEMLEELTFQLGNIEPTEDEILKAFLEANPVYEKDKLSFTVKKLPNSGVNGKPFVAMITINKTNSNYDLRLTNSIKVTYKDNGDNDLTSLVTTTDLGLITNDELKSIAFWGIVLKKLKDFNPHVKPEIISNLGFENLDRFGFFILGAPGFKVDGTNVSLPLVYYENNKVIGDFTGRIVVNFTIEPSSKPSLIDSKLLKDTDLGEIEISKGTDLPTVDQIKQLFFTKNPAYQDHRTDFNKVDIYAPTESSTEYLALIWVEDTNANYDLRLGRTILLTFTVKEV